MTDDDEQRILEAARAANASLPPTGPAREAFQDRILSQAVDILIDKAAFYDGATDGDAARHWGPALAREITTIYGTEAGMNVMRQAIALLALRLRHEHQMPNV